MNQLYYLMHSSTRLIGIMRKSPFMMYLLKKDRSKMGLIQPVFWYQEVSKVEACIFLPVRNTWNDVVHQEFLKFGLESQTLL